MHSHELGIWRWRLLTTMAALLLMPPPPALAATVSDDFAAGLDGALWQVISNSSLYSIETNHGGLLFSKPAGGTYSFQYVGVRSRTVMRGDFDVAVDFHDLSIKRVDGQPGNQVQLNTSFGGQDFLVVRSDELSPGQNVHVWLWPQGSVVGSRTCTNAAGRLRVVRSGIHLRGYADELLLFEGDYNSGDATLSLTLQNNNTRDATTVTFDNFSLTASQVLQAEHYFVETFDGPWLHPALMDPARVYQLVAGEARCTGPRNYLRTVATDFHTLDFQAEVIYTMNGGGGAGGLFFGLGAAECDPAYYSEPLFAVYAIDHAQDFASYQGTAVRSLPASGQPHMFFSWADTGTLNDGTNALRLIKAGGRLTFQMDHHYDPALGFTATYSDELSLADLPFLNATNSRLLVGTDASPTRILELSVKRLGPWLSVARLATGAVRVSWPAPAEGWLLQSTSDLVPGGTVWTDIPPPYPLQGSTDLYFLEPALVGNKFYRLHQP
jgi:hypothetical protein